MNNSIVKNAIALCIVFFLVFVVYYFKDEITNIADELFFPKEEIIIKEANIYTRGYDYEKYQITTDFEPETYNDLLNIFYTVLNSGWKTFFFYCPDEYTTCLNDVSSIIKDESLLSSINNYMSPYNSYLTVETLLDNYGKVTINSTYSYNKSMIDSINLKLSAIEAEIFTPSMTIKDKIRAMHNYIINNTRYDSNMVDTGNNPYKANTAYGPLINGYAICGGYSDAMALELDRLGIMNYKIASSQHVWNYLKLDETWYHLDLTWDDPISIGGKDRLIYTYFLISTNELKRLNKEGSHTYDENLY